MVFVLVGTLVMALLMRTGAGGRSRGGKADRAAARQGDCAEDQQKKLGSPPHEKYLPSRTVLDNRAKKAKVGP